MEDSVAIDVCNISKCYRRYAHPIDRFKELMLPGKVRGEVFWALHDVSLQIKRGESIGILGQNGSGKSTLLQIITQTLTPTAGSVEVSGRISALLELGSGFNTDFTGRQNVMINGRILGFSKRTVEAKLEEIIDFAEIGDFIDQPVHTYSSGMFVRLAFATAVVWEPEILIIDEALAVGDIFFQQKCIARIQELHQKGVTLLFVSHDAKSVLTLCSRAIVLDHGKSIFWGETARAVEKYREHYYSQFDLRAPGNDRESDYPNKSSEAKQTDCKADQKTPDIAAKYCQRAAFNTENFISAFSEKDRYGQLTGLIEGISLTNSVGHKVTYINNSDEVILSVKIGRFPAKIAPLNIGFQLRDRLGQIIIGTNTKMLGYDLLEHLAGDEFICRFQFMSNIAPGDYSISVAVAENKIDVKTIYDYINNAMAITVVTNQQESQQGGIYWPAMAISTIPKIARQN